MTTTSTTVIGNMAADPELRYLPSGDPAATFTIATNERRYNPQIRNWADGPTLYLRCNLTGPGAENAAAGLTRGTRVIAHGTLAQRNYTDRHGQTHIVTELHVQEIGPTMRFTQVHLTPAVPDQAPAGHDPAPVV
jgi:single-strand DNA-binding protein